MATIKEYLDYSELAQAAYGFLNVGTPSIEELKDQNRAKFTELQATNFAKRYTVLAISTPNTSGFSATLFLDINTGKKILSIRGTEPTDGSDYYADWELTLSKHPEQYASLVTFLEDLKSSGKISTADNLIVTGHSLGGALTQMITATYPSYVDEAYTYNSPGAKNLSIPELEIKDGKYYTREFFTLDEAGNIVYSYTEITKTLYDAYLSFDANKNSVGGKVVNVEAKDGPSVITDLGTDIGDNMEVFINADGNYFYNHSSKTLTQTLAFYNALMSLDYTLSVAEITQFLEEVDSRNIITKDQLGLHQELLSRVADILGANKASNVFDIGKNIVDTGAKHSIDFLTNKTPTQLNSRTKSNLYALLNSNPFAIEGNLPAYADINPADYSDMYMQDRAQYMYYILDKDARYGDGTGKDSYKAYDSYGVHLDGKTGNQVIFGTDNYNNDIQMNGGEGNDRIYGLAGNDVLVGNSGNDYLEGGKGFDILQGGADFDTYYAGNTDIIYDSDGKGEIYFDNINLSGVKTIVSDSDGSMYEDDNYTYFFENPNGIGELTIIEGTNTGGFSGRYITVNDFNASSQDGYLGIILAKKDINIYVGDATVLEGGVLEFTVGIDNTLEEDLVLNVESYFDDTLGASADDLTGNISGTITIKAGETSGTFEITTNDDTDMEDTEKFTFAVTSIEPYTGNDMNSHLIVNAGEGTIDDNDDETVLHVNITSVNTVEGDLDDNNQLTFIIGASRELKDTESVTLNLNINDITTDGSDYGFLSQDTITLNSTNQYQTITLDVFGDEEKEASETLSLNATVVTSTGVSDVQVISDEATIYDDDAGATPYDDFLTLTDEADTMDALAGDDYVDGKGGSDFIDGNSGNDLIFGGDGSDGLVGGSGDDVILGDAGDDVLVGDEGADYLIGGTGFDYYVSGDGDTISDSDGNGAVLFNNTDLSGVKKKLKDSDVYEDENYTYTQSNGLVVTSKTTGESINISGWSNEALGISLQESKNIEVSVGDAKAFEKEELMRATVSLDRALEEGEELVVDLGYWKNTYRYEAYGDPVYVPERSSYNSYTGTWNVSPAYTYQPQRQIKTGEVFIKHGSVTFEAGDQEKIYTYEWKDNDRVGVDAYPNPLTLTAKANEEDSIYADDIEVITGKTGTLTIIDDDERGRYDPLVLDLNKDGFIATTSLEESNTYFDLTGDGLRERVGWITSEDGLLTYDKNENGQIDGIDEVFGSVNESGFDELRRVVDSNHDNKIDKRDELFNSLQVWNDTNGDAKVQDGELRSLDEANITSIDLNALETNIDVNGNTLTEASKYTDASGNKELVADIQLNTDLKDTKVDIDDIPDYSIDETTRELPQLGGSGLVYDSFILYNIDEEFKAVAKAYASDIQKVEDSFETYIEHWSGYTKYVNELGERYSVDNRFNMSKNKYEIKVA